VGKEVKAGEGGEGGPERIREKILKGPGEEGTNLLGKRKAIFVISSNGEIPDRGE